MTDEQKKGRKLSAESGHIKWIKDNCLRTVDTVKDGEDYVFISYKSDDYKQALDDILYRACRKYGLRVYFDVAFDDGSDSWIKQFYKNMCSTHCKAMIAFLSNAYYSSYATLLEMMARKTRKAGGNGKFDRLHFVPITLEPIIEIYSDNNTGLGTERFANREINHLVSDEVKLFNNIFQQLALKDPELRGLYDPSHREFYTEAVKVGSTIVEPSVGEPYLTESICRELMTLVRPHDNENKGDNKTFEDAIYDKLMTAGLKSVFIPDWQPLPFEPVNLLAPEPDKTTVSLPEFLKKYNNNTFNRELFQKIRLVGTGEYAEYTTEYFNSTYGVGWSFVMGLLEKRGEEYIHFVNGKRAAVKNPPFITAAEHEKRKKEMLYRRLELPGLEGWSMYRNYGQYGWVNDVLRRRILELDMPLESFSLEYIPKSSEQAEGSERICVWKEPKTGNGEEGTDPIDGEEGDQIIDGVVGPVDLDGKTGTKKQSPKIGGYSFTLRGKRYHGLILKDMMLTVFKTTLPLHPDKLDILLESLACLREGLEISPDARPKTFRSGDTIEINGRSISIGTSLNRNQAQKYMEALIQLCGEPKENFVVDDDEG